LSLIRDLSMLPGLIAAVVLIALVPLSLLPFRIATVRRLRRMTREELERSVYSFHEGYFYRLGLDHPDVQTFRKLVETRDLRGLRREWRRLGSSFQRLEQKAGHHDRPLLLDFYDSYELFLRELARRGG
jgi:hypothetical protein